MGIPAGWANYLRDDISPAFDAAQLPTTVVVERVGNGSLVHVGDNPADPVLADVLQVRRAMGYPVPGAEPPVTRSGEPSSASAASSASVGGPAERRARPTPERDLDSSREKPDPGR